MQYTIYIDESGEAGIAKVRQGATPGASPYFVLGAAVFQPAAEIRARSVINEFKETIGKTVWKHATDLEHSEKVLLGRLLGQLPVRFFAVISNKSTLDDYKKTIKSDPQKFYNKCLLYLLERIFQYLSKYIVSDNDVSIILERRNHDYDTMLRYLQTVKNNPIYRESRALERLNPFAITTKAKGEDELLEIADFVSHAVYQLANKTDKNFNIPEFRYFQELSSRFAGDQKFNVLGVGLKCIHSLEQLKLDTDIGTLLRATKCKPPT